MSKVNTGQASSTLIPKYIGSDFDKVVAVADNIEQVVIVGDNIEDVITVADNIDYVKEVAEDLHGMPVTMFTGPDAPVLSPMPEGTMWYCTTDGRTYVWYTDADSGQWVESAPQSAMKDEATNIFLHSTPSNVNPAYRNATLFSTPSPEAEISVAHNTLNTPVVQAQFIREEALWVDVSVTGAQGIVTLMGYSSGNSQLKAEIITWKNGAEGTSLGASQWVTLPNQPSVVSLPVTLANIDVLDAGDSYVVKLTSQMNAGGSTVSTILVDGNTSSRFGIIFNTNLIGLNDGIRDGVTTSAPTENAVYDTLSGFTGNLAPVPEWADVPSYNHATLGGPDGPMNGQAKALAARTEQLRVNVNEALSRGQSFELIAHRGFAYLAPENTMSAYSNAVALGVTSLETDVQISSDGVPVLIHDATVDRTTDGTGNVKDLTLATLKTLNAADGMNVAYTPARIPTFDEFLSFSVGRAGAIYPEVKGYRNQSDIDLMMAVVSKYQAQSMTVWQSFTLSDLQYIRARDTRCGVGLLSGDISQLSAVAALGGRVFYFLLYTAVLANPSWVTTCRAAGVDVGVWTDDDGGDFQALLNIGVSKIMSNRYFGMGN